MRHISLFVLTLLAGAGLANTAVAAPTLVPYSGRMDISGAPFNGVSTIEAALYPAATSDVATDAVWPSTGTPATFTDVSVTDGLFTIVLGETPGEPVDSALIAAHPGGLWLALWIDGVLLTPLQPVQSVPYALTAADATMLGGVPAGDYVLTINLPDGDDFALSDQSCTSGDVVTGIASDGTLICAPDIDTDTDTTYDGTNFATSGQACTTGQVVTGIAADGTVTCAVDGGASYDGTDFATSGQACTTGQVVTGIAADGTVTCAVDGGASYDGTDFATSGQACTAGQVVTGIAADGTVTCAADANTTYSTGFGLQTSGTTFAVNTRPIPRRIFGQAPAAGVAASFGQGNADNGLTIEIDVVNRSAATPDNDELFSYRCMRVNAIVTTCRDMLTAQNAWHFSTSAATQVMFTRDGYNIVSYIQGTTPHNSEIRIVPNGSGNVMYQMTGGI